jgi:lipoyl(octanoyl) transferase
MRKTVPPSDELWVCHLGHVPYSDGVAIQEKLRARRIADELPDTLLLLEHPPVYSRGRRSADGELALGEDFYRAQGIEIVATDRGGRVTYHGPGQLVGYPIMRIGAIDSYLRTMEQAIAAALAEQGIAARGRPQDGSDYTGVWVDERKIASIGVHISHAVSTHGFAVNVDNDLQPFSWVVACGLPDVQMTSISAELGAARAPGVACFRKEMAYRFARAHGRRQRLVSARRLGIDIAHAESGAPTGAQLIKTVPREMATAVPA